MWLAAAASLSKDACPCSGNWLLWCPLQALNWLFAADRDALKAMVSLMRAPDMDAAKLGLQVCALLACGLRGGSPAGLWDGGLAVLC